MGTCTSVQAPEGPPEQSAQSAEARKKTEEATQQVAAEVTADLEQTKQEKLDTETHEEFDKRTQRNKKRKEKQNVARAARLAALKAAREMDPPALSEVDYNTAIRRLSTVTGEHATNADRKFTLPEGLEWLSELLMVLWPSIQKTMEGVLNDKIKPAMQGVMNDLPSIASAEIGTLSLGTVTPSFGPLSTRRFKTRGVEEVGFNAICEGQLLFLRPQGSEKAFRAVVVKRFDDKAEGYPKGYIDVRWLSKDQGGPDEEQPTRICRKWVDQNKPTKDAEGLQLNLCISWKSNMVVTVKTNIGEIGLTSFTFNGTLALWLHPFVPREPIVGAVQLGFVNPPQIAFETTGFVLDMLPGFHSAVQGVIDQQVADMLVLPNRIAIPLDPKLPRALVRNPLPDGILQVHVEGCDNLPIDDYCVQMRVGSRSIQSDKGTTETYRFPVFDEEQSVYIDIKKDHDDSEPIGAITGLPVKKVITRAKEGVITIPIPGPSGMNLEGKNKDKPATVKLRVDWLTIDDAVKSQGDCLISVELASLNFFPIPKDLGDLPPPGTLYVRATAGKYFDEKKVGERQDGHWPPLPNRGAVGGVFDRRQVTSASTYDSRAVGPDPAETLEDIQGFDETGVNKEQIVKGFDFLHGDLELVEQAIKKTGKKYDLENPNSAEWWQTPEVMDTWVIYRTEKQRKESAHLAVWSWANEKSKDPFADDKELDRRAKWYEASRKYQKWCDALQEKFQTYKATVQPYWGQVLHTYVPEEQVQEDGSVDVLLEFIQGPPGDKEKLLGTIVVKKVKDDVHAQVTSKQGSWEESVGFDKSIDGETSSVKIGKASARLEDSGVRIRDVVHGRPLPASWNTFDAKPPPDWQGQEAMDEYYKAKGKAAECPKDAKARKAWAGKLDGKRWKAINWEQRQTRAAMPDELVSRIAWYDDRKTLAKSEGSPAEKKQAKQKQEAALQNCLDVGALTWGDYDTLLQKLNGEDDVSTIAETLEWVNMLLCMLWQPLNVYLENLAHTSLKAMIDEKVADYSSWGLKGVDIECTLGSRPLSFGTIQCVKKKPKGKTNSWGGAYAGCTLKLNDILLDSDVEVVVNVRTIISNFVVGAKNIYFRGSCEIDLGPMLPKAPCFGGVTVSFPCTPSVDLELVGDSMSKIEKAPNMDAFINESIQAVIASVMVPPNFLAIQLDPSVNNTSLAFPAPLGVLEVQIKGAQKLIAGDTSLLGGKSSDVYVQVFSAGTHYKTEVLDSCKADSDGTVSCDWEEDSQVFHFVIFKKAERICFSVFDKDTLSDDLLGKVFSKKALVGGNTLYPEGMTVQELLSGRPASEQDEHRVAHRHEHEYEPEKNRYKHVCSLEFKHDDEELSDASTGFKADKYYKLEKYPAGQKASDYANVDGKLTMYTRWLTQSGTPPAGDPVYHLSFLASNASSLPGKSKTDLNGPFFLGVYSGNTADFKAGEDVPDGAEPLCITQEGEARPGTDVAPLDLLADVSGAIKSLEGKSDEEIAETVGRQFNIPNKMVTEIMTEPYQTTKAVRLHIRYLIKRPGDTDKNLKTFKEKWKNILKTMKNAKKPRDIREDSAACWAHVGIQPHDIQIAKTQQAWTKDFVGEAAFVDANIAIASLGFLDVNGMLDWFADPTVKENLDELVQFHDPRTVGAEEDVVPVDIIAPKDQMSIFRTKLESMPDYLAKAKGYTYYQGSLTRGYPLIEGTTVAMAFRMPQKNEKVMKRWKEFLKAFFIIALGTGGILSCSSAQEDVCNGDLIAVKILLTADDTHAIKKLCEHITKEFNFRFPYNLGTYLNDGDTKLVRTTVMTTKQQAETFRPEHLDGAGVLFSAAALAPPPAVIDQGEDITMLHPIVKPLELQVKQFAWGERARAERAERLAHRNPHWNRVHHRVLTKKDLGDAMDTKKLPITIVLLDNDKSKVVAVLKKPEALDLSQARHSIPFEGAQAAWALKPSGISSMFGGEKADGECKLTATVTLQAMDVHEKA